MNRFTVGGFVLALVIAALGQVAGNRLDKAVEQFVVAAWMPSVGYTDYDYTSTSDYKRPAKTWCHNGSAYWRC